MFKTPAAIGYLRSDVSGQRMEWDQIQIRSVARRLGYTLSKTLVLNSYTENPLQKVIEAVTSRGAEAVIVPGVEHFGGGVPEELVAVVDVVTISPEQTYARWIIPPDAVADMGAR
ncbi:hypothetical protein GFY24_01010 [Nocardia sp. SYP-A9097]|nr:hypothetical protein [Nocardia sp. SYP-A9097]